MLFAKQDELIENHEIQVKDRALTLDSVLENLKSQRSNQVSV